VTQTNAPSPGKFTTDRQSQPWIFALVIALLILLTEQVIEHFAQRSIVEEEQAHVIVHLSTIRARLEGEVNSNLLLVQGLAAVIAAQPNMDQTEFARIAKNLTNKGNALRNIVGAPDMVASLLYPVAGNEAVLGLNYRTHPTQSAEAMRAMEQGKPIIAGPLELVQGGIGIIAREPVFIVEDPGIPPRPWGLISAVLDTDELYRVTGLDKVDHGLQLAIRGTDGTGADGPVFFGEPQVFQQTPVTLDVSLPSGSWQLAAMPAAGWGESDSTLVIVRILGVLIALAAAVAGYLLSQGNIRLTRTAEQLGNSEARLRTLLNTIPDLIWMKDPQGAYLFCNPRFEAIYGAKESEIRGKYDRDFIDASQADEIQKRDQTAIASSTPQTYEEWVVFSDDDHRELHETIKTPVYNNNAKLIGIMGIGRDITKRKQTEDELRKQKALLDRTSRLAKVGGWQFDVDTLEGYFTEEARRIHDLEPNASISLEKGLSFYTEESRPLIEQAVKNALEQGTPYDLELEMITATGAHKWIRAMGQPIKEGGKVVRVEGAIQDISDLHEAEAIARQRETVLDSVFQSIPDLFFLMDADGTIRDYRAQQTANLYVPPEAFLGKRMSEVLPPDVSQLFSQKLQLAFMQKKLITYEYDLAISGEVRRFESRLSKLPDSDQCIAIVRDITEQHHTHQALTQSEQRYRNLLENAPFPALLSDAENGTLLYCNRRVETLFGLNHDQGIGMLASVFYQNSANRQGYIDQLKAQQHIYDLELPMQTLDGKPFWALVSASLIDSVIFTAINDISDRKNMEAEITALNSQLEKRVLERTRELDAANKELETFTYSVSHDLKAPLRGIDGYSRLLQEQYDSLLDEEGQLFLGNVREGVEQMNRLINDLLAYSRMERRKLQNKLIDIRQQVEKILAESREQIQATGAIISVNVDDIYARADLDGFAIVVRNLLDNALKFSRDSQPPTIQISATRQEKSIILEIKDNGIGFDMQFHERIFEIFQRLQRAEDYPGTGVGLAIVAKAIKRMNGRVWAESTPGAGATFFVELAQ